MLKDKVVVITGGGKGIGRFISRKVTENGASLAIIYGNSHEGAKQVKDHLSTHGVKCEIYKCDVSNFDQTNEVMQKILGDFGRVDVLINNAGITKDNLVLKMTEEDFERVIDINLKGCFNTIKALYSNFTKNKSGKIVNISSVVGLSGNAGQVNYASSKAGLIGLTKSVARELAARNINCNAIAPGYIDTDMTSVLSDKVKENVLSNIPLKRFGVMEDVANLAVFLSSSKSDYITGEVIKVDGGLYI